MSTIKSYCLAGRSETGERLMALALFTRISIPPKVFTASATAATTCSSSRISHFTANPFPPAALISSTAEKIVPPSLGSSSVDFAAMIMFAPSDANFNAIAFPIPRDPPVMKTVFPL